MSITYTLRRRDSRSFTGAGSGVTFTVATGPRGPSSISDATALGTLTDASADALFLLAANAAGTAARKVTLGSVARSFLGATTQAAGRTAIDAEQAGTAASAVAAHTAASDPHPQYALESALGTVAAINLPGGTTVFLRGDGTWAAAAGGTVASTDITDSTVVGRAVLTAADAAAARSAIGAGTGSGDALTSGTLGQFAATTSAQLAGVLSDETGSGAAVFAGSPALTGTVVVRQTGGVAGTDEVQISHNGTHGYIRNKDTGGRLYLGVNGAEFYSDNAGNLVAPGGIFSGNSAGFGSGATGIAMRSNYAIVWSGGSNYYDAASGGLIRSAAKVVGLTDGSTGGGTLSSVPLTPTQITSNQNNYAPGVAHTYRLSTDASRDITGLSISQVSGQWGRIFNVGSFNIVLKHQDANSTAANRFLSVTGADITLAPDEGAGYEYDSTTSRFRAWKL